MHSFNAPSGLTYHHNGDCSGGVRVEIPMGRRAAQDYGVPAIDNNARTVTVDIPFKDIRALYLNHLRNRRISMLENADDDALEEMWSGK